jgi:hypothetical protein
MKNSITFEWAVEYTDEFGDIHDSDFSEGSVHDIWPPRRSVEGCFPVLCSVRYKGNNEHGEVERGYAYAGDIHYSSGQAVDFFKRQFLIKTL